MRGLLLAQKLFMFRWLHDHGAHVVLEQSMVCGFAGAFFQCSLGGSVKEVLGTHIQAPIAGVDSGRQCD